MKRYTRAQMLEAVLDRVRAEGLRETARRADVDAGYLSRVVNGLKPLSDDAALKLGFEKLPEFYVLARERQ